MARLMGQVTAELGLELRCPDSLGSELSLLHLSFARSKLGFPLE